MIKVKLTKLQSNHNNLRTDSIEGETSSLPVALQKFVMYGEGLEFGTRMIMTTPVLEFKAVSEKEIEFKTRNSHYKLELLA